jgi:glycosyltransferase involved in cell wall biosynthesis
VKVLLVQTTIGDYRQRVLERIVEKLGDDFKIVCGKEYFYKSLKIGVQLGNVLTLIDNYFFLGRRLLFQPRAVLEALIPDVVILELNPRIVSNWLIILFRKILGKKTVLWGHAWPRQGKDSSTDRIRQLMRSLADVIVVYTETQRKDLNEKMSHRKPIIAAPNALYRVSDMHAVSRSARTDFIYVGRIVEDKKVALAVKAFAKVQALVPECRLLIVGDGPALVETERLAGSLIPEGRVEFFGHISKIDLLKNLYSHALASLSPGYVGLSITQSFGFGVPMIIADDEPHAPEIEAATNNVNALFFKADDEDSLAGAMLEIWKNREEWITRDQAINQICIREYSVETMAERLIEAMYYGI